MQVTADFAPETRKTHVLWLITRRPRIQILPRYQAQRPSLTERASRASRRVDLVLRGAAMFAARRPEYGRNHRSECLAVRRA